SSATAGGGSAPGGGVERLTRSRVRPPACRVLRIVLRALLRVRRLRPVVLHPRGRLPGFEAVHPAPLHRADSPALPSFLQPGLVAFRGYRPRAVVEVPRVLSLDTRRELSSGAIYAPVATYGATIFFGSTTRSNSTSVTKPSFRAAAFKVRSLSIA